FERSWQFLTPSEQFALGKLSLLRGEFDQAVATGFAQASQQIMMVLTNKSLVSRVQSGRFDIHTLIRRFLHEKLDAGGQLAAGEAQHAHFFAEHALQLTKNSMTSNLITDRFEQYYHDFQAALGWSLTTQNCGQLSRNLTTSLVAYWKARG